MTNKEAFIKIVEAEIFSNNIYEKDYEEEYPLALSFWNDFKEGKIKEKTAITENGLKILSFMQEYVKQDLTNAFTSVEIANELSTSGRSVAGTMRKLVKDGYVEKTGKDPVHYSLTELGKTYQI